MPRTLHPGQNPQLDVDADEIADPEGNVPYPAPSSPGGAAEPGTLVAENVGTHTTYAGHLYVGDEDPAIEHAAELLPGDKWTMTGLPVVTGFQPVIDKIRNADNDGWDPAGLGMEVDGVLRLVLQFSGTAFQIAAFDELGGIQGYISLDATGQIAVTNAAGDGVLVGVPGGDGTTVSGKTSLMHGGDLVLGSLPTTDPAVETKVWESPGGVLRRNGGEFAETIPELPATPTEQDIADALVLLKLATQAAP